MSIVLSIFVVWIVIAFVVIDGKKPKEQDKPSMIRNATCGQDIPTYSRQDIWETCFMPLGGMAVPMPGSLNEAKIQTFRDQHLYWFERWVSPSAATIMERCDSVPRDGWVTKAEFLASNNPDCLGTADSICRVRDVCVRERKNAGLPSL